MHPALHSQWHAGGGDGSDVIAARANGAMARAISTSANGTVILAARCGGAVARGVGLPADLGSRGAPAESRCGNAFRGAAAIATDATAGSSATGESGGASVGALTVEVDGERKKRRSDVARELRVASREGGASSTASCDFGVTRAAPAMSTEMRFESDDGSPDAAAGSVMGATAGTAAASTEVGGTASTSASCDFGVTRAAPAMSTEMRFESDDGSPDAAAGSVMGATAGTAAASTEVGGTASTSASCDFGFTRAAPA